MADEVTPMYIEVIVLGENGLEIRKVPNTKGNQPKVVTTEELIELITNKEEK